MKKIPLPSPATALCLCFALIWGPAFAEKADRNKPMNIEADALRYDDLKQTSVFTGKVVVSKGTINVRGARVEVRQDAEGYQYGVITGEPGGRAFFRQKREGVDEYIEGEAETIEYNSKSDTVRFVKRAELRRFRGTTVNDEMVGSLIVYDNLSDVFTVDGNVANPNAGTSSGTGGRIRAMLTPRNAASAAAAPPTGAGPSPQLRPSMTIGGEKK